MENKMETKKISFEGGELLGVKDQEEKVWLCVAKACQDIGFTKGQIDNEVKKIKNNELFIMHNSFKYLSVKFDAQVRDYLFLEERDVSIWLAQINITPKMKIENPEASLKLLKYQDKAAKVLHNAFFETQEQKEEFFNDMGLKGEIVELKTQVNELTNEIVNNREQLETMDKTMGTLINSATINSYQAKQLNLKVRERISTMLGGAHSSNYKKKSRMYFKNLWLNLCDKFSVSEYRDLNPLNYNDAVTFVTNWSMM